MTVPEFFGCQDRHTFITRSPEEVKGIVVNVTKNLDSMPVYRTFIFFDLFYLVVDLDMVEEE